MILTTEKYLSDVMRCLSLDIKKVPFKLQLKWNDPERAGRNKSPTHSSSIDSVTFLLARFNSFANSFVKNLKTRRNVA